MKKSIHSGIASKGSQSKQKPYSDTKVPDSFNNLEVKAFESISSVTSSNFPLTTVHKPVATGRVKSKHEGGDDDKCESIGESVNSSEEDAEFDEEVVRKLLERKIEQAPAAKVIVSEAMMSEALSEMNARKSGISTTAKTSTQTLVSALSMECVGDQNPITTTASSASASTARILFAKSSGHIKDRGDGDAPIPTSSISELPSVMNIRNMEKDALKITSSLENGEEGDSSGCPLEKILEFLQAVMTKDYKRALVLAREILEYEPKNELVLEYMTVLKQIVHKEEENECEDSDSDMSNDSSADVAGEYAEELTTSSETDSVSDDEDSESSTESRFSSSTSERESDEDEEPHHNKPEVTDSECNKHEENVTVEKQEDVKVGKGLDGDTNADPGQEAGEVQSKDNAEHINATTAEVL